MNLRILVPEATTNYITNPALRFATTGWNAVGSTITRTLDQARFGIASLKVVTNGSAVGEGTFYRVSSLSGISDNLTASAYVRGQGKVRLRLIDNPTGKEWYSKTISLDLTRWTRLHATGRSTGSNDLRLYVETTGTAKAVTFYVDGAQMERKPFTTTYCDGDQPGCKWNLVAHESISTRDGFTRAGGKWIPLAGPCRPNNDIYVTVLGGFGMAPMVNNIQPWANAPGSYFQNIKVLNRVVTLSFHAKKENLRLIGAPKLDHLYELRQQLIDIIKPDRTQGGESFLFEYDDGERPLYMRFRYEAGLEGEWDVRNGWVNSFPLRLLAVDPFWVEDNQNVKDLDFSETLPGGALAHTAFARINGIWDEVKNSSGTAPNSTVYVTAYGPKGEVYFGGDFTTIGNRIVKWDGTRYTELGNGGANNIVYAIAVAADGTVYATGDFTSIGGVAATRVAKYNPLTNTWSALSTGLNGTGRAICVAPNGQVYMGGDFTTAGGVTMNYITRWDGTQFRTVGAPTGVSTTVRVIINAEDGQTLYFGGDFSQPAPGDGDRLASIDLTTNLITYTAGVNNSVYALAVGKDRTIYFAGSFTAQASSPNPSIKRIGYIQGGTLHQLGDGFADGEVRSLSVTPDGLIYIGGSFTLSGVLPIPKIAKYTRGAILPVDFYPSKTSASESVYSILAHPNGNMYVGLFAGNPKSYASGITTVANEGTAEVQPTIYVSGPGTLRFLENWTTKKRVYFNLTLLSGEEVMIDFAKASITSNMRGSLMRYVLNGSDFKSFSLLPGDNQIAAFMTDDINGAMKISYIPIHWSVDAVVDAEELS